VVTYAAVVEVENPDVKLRPGMTANVSIHVAEAKNARCIPNAALHFRPSSRVDASGKSLAQERPSLLGPGKARIHVLADETPGAEKIKMLVVDIGISDGTNTVLDADLEGAKVVVDENDEPSKSKWPF
jgi:HlyD family secretion protein